MRMIDQVLTSERLALLEWLRGLDDQAWARPSLCAGWSARDVLAHLITPFEVSLLPMGLSMLRHGPAGAMDLWARTLAQRPVDELLEILERHVHSSFRPPGLPLAAPLTDVLIHGLDIRWSQPPELPRVESHRPRASPAGTGIPHEPACPGPFRASWAGAGNPAGGRRRQVQPRLRSHHPRPRPRPRGRPARTHTGLRAARRRRPATLDTGIPPRASPMMCRPQLQGVPRPQRRAQPGQGLRHGSQGSIRPNPRRGGSSCGPGRRCPSADSDQLGEPACDRDRACHRGRVPPWTSRAARARNPGSSTHRM